eukprot:4513894-Pyramimonas_sp.AAC.1
MSQHMFASVDSIQSAYALWMCKLSKEVEPTWWKQRGAGYMVHAGYLAEAMWCSRCDDRRPEPEPAR